MSEIGLIERSTLSGLIEEIKRLRGTDEPLTPKHARSIASTLVAEGVNPEEVKSILEDYLEENLDVLLDDYMNENLDGRMDKHLDENLDTRMDSYLNENLDTRMDTYMNENLDERLDTHLDKNIDEHIGKYLEENPPIAKITINGEGPDENGNFNIECGSVDSNNVVEF